MTYPHAIAVTWSLALLLALLLAYDMAHAETGPYLDAAGGVSNFINTLPDGVWVQRGMNYDLDTHALAWKAGAGWRITEQWAIQASYVNFGTTRVASTFVDDNCYDPKAHRRLSSSGACQLTGNLTASDALQGVELIASYRWQFGEWRPYVKAGGAYLLHRFTIENYNQSFAEKHYGQFPAAIGGLGLEYQWAYIETTYYSLIGEQPRSTPISTQIVLTTFGLRVPL